MNKPTDLAAFYQPLKDAWHKQFKPQASVKSKDRKSRNSRRIFHGRGQCFPNLEWCSVDYFDPIVLVTFYVPPLGEQESYLLQWLCDQVQQLKLDALVIQRRYDKGAPFDLAFGVLPDILIAKRGELRFYLNLEQQNIGFFLDMEPGRQWLEQRCRAKKVLNLFAYTCAFSVVALAAGAAGVVNVDMSSRALSTGRENHRLNGQNTGGVTFLADNILKSWGRIRRHGPYDVIIIDPPSFQKGSFIAERDYHKLVRRIPQLAACDADILACLNAPELNQSFLHEIFRNYSSSCDFIARLTPDIYFPDLQEDKALKLLHYKNNGP